MRGGIENEENENLWIAFKSRTSLIYHASIVEQKAKNMKEANTMKKLLVTLTVIGVMLQCI